MVFFRLLFLLQTTIRPKYTVFFHFFFLCTTLRSRIMFLSGLLFLFAHYHLTNIYGFLSFCSFFCAGTFVRPRILVLTDFFFICTEPFDQNIWSLFIYSVFFQRLLNESIINLFFLLCTTILPKIWSLINSFCLFAHERSTKVYGSLSFSLSFTHNHLTKS